MPANYLWTGGEWFVHNVFLDEVWSGDKMICVCHADVYEEACANAARIVLCCNEHEKLKAVAQGIIELDQLISREDMIDGLNVLIEHASAAIAKAEGK